MAGEKDEKDREKEMEKNQEKWERDPLGAVIWALILHLGRCGAVGHHHREPEYFHKYPDRPRVYTG